MRAEINTSVIFIVVDMFSLPRLRHFRLPGPLRRRPHDTTRLHSLLRLIPIRSTAAVIAALLGRSSRKLGHRARGDGTDADFARHTYLERNLRFNNDPNINNLFPLSRTYSVIR